MSQQVLNQLTKNKYWNSVDGIRNKNRIKIPTKEFPKDFFDLHKYKTYDLRKKQINQLPEIDQLPTPRFNQQMNELCQIGRLQISNLDGNRKRFRNKKYCKQDKQNKPYISIKSKKKQISFFNYILQSEILSQHKLKTNKNFPTIKQKRKMNWNKQKQKQNDSRFRIRQMNLSLN